MNGRLLKYKLLIVVTWTWSSTSGYQAHDTASSHQADQWRYVEHKLYVEPQEKARSYFERYITEFFTIGCWFYTAGFNSLFLHSLAATDEREDDGTGFNEFRVISGICASSSLFFTLIATSLIQIRNNYFLVRSAENRSH